MAGYDYSEPVKNEKGTWYHTIYEECPACGLGRTYKTRRPGPAPAPTDYKARYEYVLHYDYCLESW